MANIKYENFKYICRMCLSACDINFNKNSVMLDIFHKLTDIHFEANYELPQQICLKCFDFINNIHAFTMTCQQTHFVLMECLNNYKNKRIKEEPEITEVMEITNEELKIEFVEVDCGTIDQLNEDVTDSTNDLLTPISTQNYEDISNSKHPCVPKISKKLRNPSFKCDQCKESFNRLYDLTTHKRVHSGEPPYKCPLNIMDQTQSLSPPMKRRAKHFSVEDKERILNIFKVCCEQNPNNNKTENVAFTAKAAGICIASVSKILRDYNKEHRLDPPKVYHRKRAVLDNIDDLTKSKLRRLVHGFLERNEKPTLNKIMAALHEDEDMPNLKRTTLALLLKEIGFKYEK